MAHDGQQQPLRQRAAGVARRGERGGRDLLDRGEVVVPLPHHQPQLRVGLPGLLGRGGGLGPLPAQLGVQRGQVLEHVVGHLRGDLEGRQVELRGTADPAAPARSRSPAGPGGWADRRRNSSPDGTSSASASALSSDSLGSLRPFSSIESADGARFTRAPSSASVRPRARRRWRSLRPNVRRSWVGRNVNDDASSSTNSVMTSSYVKFLKFSFTWAWPWPIPACRLGHTTRGRHGRGLTGDGSSPRGQRGFVG